MDGGGNDALSAVVRTHHAALAWAALAAFILYGSSGPIGGPRTAALPGISAPDIAQNVLLYVPFGVFGVWTLRRFIPSRAARLGVLLAVAFAYSATMELLQMIFGGRIASAMDVGSNVFGTLVGAMVAARAERGVEVGLRWSRNSGLSDTPLRYLLAVILVAIIGVAWYPFDVTLDISTLSDRTRAVRRDPLLWPAASELWMQAARFAALAAVTALSLRNLSRRAAPVAFALTLVTAAVVDAGQLGMGSHPVGVAAFMSQAAGAAAGVGLALIVFCVRGTKYAAA